ncbi:hypothetical protein [Tepidimonas sp.]|uniref:hypothetical protein n=1 Tax=Tepidimonas sp. TaxID=2002775 RepID=UPI0026358E8F|nr:hypothetical protein [Tepidimonas sp.]
MPGIAQGLRHSSFGIAAMGFFALGVVWLTLNWAAISLAAALAQWRRRPKRRLPVQPLFP